MRSICNVHGYGFKSGTTGNTRLRGAPKFAIQAFLPFSL
jgi:hypothetical protein